MEIKTRVLTNPQHLEPSRRETARKNIAAIGKIKVSPNTRLAPPEGSDELDLSEHSVPTPDASGKILKSLADGKYSWETPYGIEQVPADWDQVDRTKPDYINNKPGLYQGATDEHPGSSGFVPAALSDERDLFLKGDGTWGTPDCTPGDGKLYIALGNGRPTDTGFSANAGNNVIVSIPEASEEEPGLLSADDKEKLNNIDISDIPSKSSLSIVDGTGADADKTTITLKENTSTTVLTAHQDISGKADKREMSITSDGDHTTITLKNGTSTTVINSHQTIPSSSTSAAGIVQLSNDINSSSENVAATSKAIKDVYDALDAKLNARAVFFGSTAEWDNYKTEHPIGDPSKVYYVQTGNGADKYTVYVWKLVAEGTSYYEKTDESSISLEGYWHGAPNVVSGQNKTDEFVSGVTLNNDGSVSVTTRGVQNAVASVNGIGGSHGLITAEDQEKLNGISSGAQVNVKPDWKAASGNEAEILNKPELDSTMSSSEDNGATYWGVKNPLPDTIGNAGDVLTVKNGSPAWESLTKLPSAPINNGKYVLTCTVTNGTAAYAWEVINTTTV